MFNDDTTGFEHARKHSGPVSVALAKLLRQQASYINKRDEAAIEDFCKNIRDYVIVDVNILNLTNRLHKRHTLTRKGLEEWAELYD